MQTFCTLPGCDRFHHARGLCGTHYRRWSLGQSLTVPVGALAVPRPRPLCTVPGCDRPNDAHGLCGTHRRRKRLGQSLTAPIRTRRRRRERWYIPPG